MRRLVIILAALVAALALMAAPVLAGDALEQAVSGSGDNTAYGATWSGTYVDLANTAWRADSRGVLGTTYYDLHYGSWESVASALTPYLDSAFDAARDVLSYDNGGYDKIDIYFYSEPDSGTNGYTYIGDNALYLNIRAGSDTSDFWMGDYGNTVSHETSHIMFDHKTDMSSYYDSNQVGFYAVVWLTEALAYYTGDVKYQYGSRYSKDLLGYNLWLYSNNGSTRQTWWGSGYNYQEGYTSDLDYIQLLSIGQFLSDQGGGDDSLARLTSYMAESKDFEGAFRAEYGMETGQFSVASGAGVNTLYSQYLNYYLGHY